MLSLTRSTILLLKQDHTDGRQKKLKFAIFGNIPTKQVVVIPYRAFSHSCIPTGMRHASTGPSTSLPHARTRPDMSLSECSTATTSVPTTPFRWAATELFSPPPPAWGTKNIPIIGCEHGAARLSCRCAAVGNRRGSRCRNPRPLPHRKPHGDTDWRPTASTYRNAATPSTTSQS